MSYSPEEPSPSKSSGNTTEHVNKQKDLHWQEVKSTSHPGDRYIKFHRLPDIAAKTSEAVQVISWDQPEQSNLWRKLKRFLIGQPLTTSHSSHERLSKLQGLAILSSDALSSVAYATEAALFILVMGFERDNPTQWIVPISLVICFLTFIVASSYRQTIFAYPGGGGSYLVAKDNFGTTVGLFAAAALLIDYVLNVAVSVSSGTANFVSAFPDLAPYSLPIMLGLVVILVLGNLRGIRESGAIFALPVYFFILSFLSLIGVGAYQVLFTAHPTILFSEETRKVAEYNTQAVGLILILQAFASGCTAMTGVEAISNGVPAFRKPESKNAATTLVWMAAILITFFIGISFLADAFKARPNDHDTVISQLSRVIFGDASIGYYIVQAATTLILILSANTSFADFPRMASILSKDKFLPHIFTHRGDRLAFSTGIIALGGLAMIILVIFNGSLQALIPLFAVGVFLAFTLSQAGMVAHWQKEKHKKNGVNPVRGIRRRQLLNGLGAICTGIALVVIAASKFLTGAWLVVLLIPVLFGMFKAISRHYEIVDSQTELDRQQNPSTKSLASANRSVNTITLNDEQSYQIIVPVATLNKVSLSTLNFARALGPRVTAIFVSDDQEAIARLRAEWRAENLTIPLTVLESPYRSVIRPLLAYLNNIHERNHDEVVMVVLPEFVVKRWWEQILHNQTALRLKAALLGQPGVVVTSVPYHIE